MSIFDTPLYKASIALQARQAIETEAALKACRSEYQRDQAHMAMARKHWAEHDVLCQQHRMKPMAWPINGGLPVYL